MSGIKLPACALNLELVGQIRQWITDEQCDNKDMDILIVGGPARAAKRQHVLAGLFGTEKWPACKRATAESNDSSGEYSFLLRNGLAEIDFGLYAGNYRKNATTCVIGASRALEHQSRMRQNGAMLGSDSFLPASKAILLFRNVHVARHDCLLAALNNAARSGLKIILITERPTSLTYITSAWRTSIIIINKQEELYGAIRANSNYLSYCLHEQKANNLAKSALKIIKNKNGATIASIQKLATELQKEQHDPIYMATMLLREIENNSKKNGEEQSQQRKLFLKAIKKLINGIENGYRLNLHLELFLATLAGSEL